MSRKGKHHLKAPEVTAQVGRPVRQEYTLEDAVKLVSSLFQMIASKLSWWDCELRSETRVSHAEYEFFLRLFCTNKVFRNTIAIVDHR